MSEREGQKREFFLAVQHDGEEPIPKSHLTGKKIDNLEDIWSYEALQSISRNYYECISGYRVTIDPEVDFDISQFEDGEVFMLPEEDGIHIEYLGVGIISNIGTHEVTIFAQENYDTFEDVQNALKKELKNLYLRSPDFEDNEKHLFGLVSYEDYIQGELWKHRLPVVENYTEVQAALMQVNNNAVNTQGCNATVVINIGVHQSHFNHFAGSLSQNYTQFGKMTCIPEPYAYRMYKESRVHIPKGKWNDEQFFVAENKDDLNVLLKYVKLQDRKACAAEACTQRHPDAHLSHRQQEYLFTSESYTGPTDIAALKDLKVCRNDMAGFASAWDVKMSPEMCILQDLTEFCLECMSGKTLEYLPILWNSIAKHADAQHPETFEQAIRDGIKDFLPYTNTTEHVLSDGTPKGISDRTIAEHVYTNGYQRQDISQTLSNINQRQQSLSNVLQKSQIELPHQWLHRIGQEKADCAKRVAEMLARSTPTQIALLSSNEDKTAKMLAKIYGPNSWLYWDGKSTNTEGHVARLESREPGDIYHIKILQEMASRCSLDVVAHINDIQIQALNYTHTNDDDKYALEGISYAIQKHAHNWSGKDAIVIQEIQDRIQEHIKMIPSLEQTANDYFQNLKEAPEVQGAWICCRDNEFKKAFVNSVIIDGCEGVEKTALHSIEKLFQHFAYTRAFDPQRYDSSYASVLQAAQRINEEFVAASKTTDDKYDVDNQEHFNDEPDDLDESCL